MTSADPPTIEVTRQHVLAFRLRRHQLTEPATNGAVDLLRFGVQDTGNDGSAWALAIRGGSFDPDELSLAWTVRGAPHAYRRADLAAVAVATAPYNEVDAAKRIFDASKPLKAAGIPVLDALVVVAGHLRELAREPIVKGDASGALRHLLDEPYLRSCRPCNAIHIYELPFRLAALHAGLELRVGTSPPILERVPDLDPPMYQRLAGEADPDFDVIRNHLRFFGPATPKDTAVFLDAAPAAVKASWPADAVPVTVTDGPPPAGGPAYVLADDVDDLRSPEPPSSPPLLLGPYDPYLQLRDRELLVADPVARKALWPVLGRPGAVVIDGEIAALWRPKSSGRKLALRLDPLRKLSGVQRTAVEAQGERLAAHRGVTFAGIIDEPSTAA